MTVPMPEEAQPLRSGFGWVQLSREPRIPPDDPGPPRGRRRSIVQGLGGVDYVCRGPKRSIIATDGDTHYAVRLAYWLAGATVAGHQGGLL